jgi:anaerobic magnesium-protoporphyrin IX monomethyl ester cyclase
MRILFLNPPFMPRFSREQRSPAVTKSGTLYYPMWLCYAAGYCEDLGHDVRLIDAPAVPLDLAGVLERLDGFVPELLVLDTSTPSLANDIAVAGELKKRWDKLFVVGVGPHVSALPAETLELANGALDAVCLGEYELTVAELAQRLSSQKALDGIPGLAIRKADGSIIIGPPRPPLEDLDILPFVSRSYKKFLNYKDYFYSHSLHPIITVLSARGCPNRCIYCVYPQVFSGRRYRPRRAEMVVEEMLYIQREFPEAREIMFEDDTFAIDQPRAIEICELMRKKGVKIAWSANARVDTKLETLKAMKKAGCRLLCVGVESGEQSILDGIKKGTTVGMIRRFFADAHKAGVKVHGCFMVGNPGETEATMALTLQMALELDPDTAQFFPIMPYPGTELYNWAREHGYLNVSDWAGWLNEEGGHNTLVDRPELSSRALVTFCDMARRRFYLRPGYIAKKLGQVLTGRAEAGRLLKSFGTFRRYLFRSGKEKKERNG